MPERLIVAQQLASILSVIAHTHRIRVIEALGARELDVQSITSALELPQATVSQHLAQLRSKGIVRSRRDGHHVFYRLSNPWLARWLVDGFALLELQTSGSDEVLAAAKIARKLWQLSERSQ